MREVRTLRLVLEPQVEAHAIAMFDVLSDPAIYQYENEPPASLEWLRERYRKLESRASGDGTQQWLNWVVRYGGELIGYVQATVYDDGHALVAYVLASRWWGRGMASEAVAAMLDELQARYRVDRVVAIFKTSNVRSRRLLEGLRFAPSNETVDPDESALERLLP